MGVALITTGVAVAASGTGRFLFDQRCDHASDLCWSTVAEGSSVYLVMQSPDHGGRYQVCVTPPQGRGACRPVSLRHRPPGPLGYVGFAARVDFAKSFTATGSGQYVVRWKSYPAGLPLSPALAFELGPDGMPRIPRG